MPSAQRTKRLSSVLGAGGGLLCAAAVALWPDKTGKIQICWYSVSVLGLVLWGHWSRRNLRRFWEGFALVLLLHCFLMYSIRSIFPFKSVFTVVPLMLLEGTAAVTLILKLVEPEDVSNREHS